AAERVARLLDLQLRPTTIPLPAPTRWQELLEKAWTENRIPDVLAAANTDHPNNSALARAIQEYWIRLSPALRVENGRFEPPPPEWQILEEHRAMIEVSIKSVCLFMLEGNEPPTSPHGLGFLIGKRTILTHQSMVPPSAERALLAFADRHSSPPLEFKERRP